jgi:hypothetical protein
MKVFTNPETGTLIHIIFVDLSAVLKLKFSPDGRGVQTPRLPRGSGFSKAFDSSKLAVVFV